jgi:outer membrane protein assembly factor BamB
MFAMKNAVWAISLIFTLILMNSRNAFSQDWPQWRGVDRDCVVTGFHDPSEWPPSLKQVWKISVGSGDATPILIGDKIYLNTRQGNNEVVLCLDAATGKEIWKDQYQAMAVTGPAGSHPGPRSTPAYANEKIYTYGASGILSCLDAGSGKVIWRMENPKKEVPDFFTAMSPLIVDNLLIAHIGTKDKGQVLAIDSNTGKEKWAWTGDGPSYASPSLMIIDGKKHIIVQTEKNLISLDLNSGRLLWKIATPVKQRFYNCVSPYINGKIIYFTGQGTGTKAVEVEKSGNGYITKELWNNPVVGAKWNTPVLKNGFLYGFSDQKRIFCLNALTGQTAWIDNTPNSDFATLIDCGSVLIGLPSTANLLVFNPHHTTYSQVAGYKVSNTPIFAFPVIAGNKIYIKDAETLTLYSLE